MPKPCYRDEDEEMPEGEPRKRLKWSPDINAGHVLTFASMIVGVAISGAVGYATSQSSRAILEYRLANTERVQEQMASTQTKLTEAINELQKQNVKLVALQEAFNRELERRKP